MYIFISHGSSGTSFLKKLSGLLIRTFLLFMSAVPFVSCFRGEGDYHEEADRFLAGMPAGLQDRQCAAIRKALVFPQYDVNDLQEVRKARNATVWSDSRVAVTPLLGDTLMVYVPVDRTDNPLPLLVYFHGGGWVIGSNASCSRFCGELAATGKAVVVSVEYPLAPEHPFPEGLEYCSSALTYVMENASSWGSAPELVSLGGDSSGGNLALTVTLSRIRNGLALPRSLVLFYPVVSAWADGSRSWKNYGRGYGLDAEIMNAFNDAYCHGGADPRKDALISPSLADDKELSLLPPVLFIAAERDILHDQGRDFCRRLLHLDVPVSRSVLLGSVHLFITVPGQDSAFREAVRASSEFLETP